MEAFRHNGLIICTDILSIKGNHIKLMEVKDILFDANDECLLLGKRVVALPFFREGYSSIFM
jgi:hypothetical protein